MSESNDVAEETEEAQGSWLVRSLYVGLIAANLWLAFDWWRDTPQGEAVIERCRLRYEAAKAKAENCEGCAHRKAWLQKQVNRVHWQATEIVEEAAAEQPEQP